MAIIDKKITFTVQEMTDKGATVLLKFRPTMPEGTTWAKIRVLKIQEKEWL